MEENTSCNWQKTPPRIKNLMVRPQGTFYIIPKWVSFRNEMNFISRLHAR